MEQSFCQIYVNFLSVLTPVNMWDWRDMYPQPVRTATKNAVKVLGYWDIFKNYYANKQEENYYMIGSNDPLSIKINNVEVTDPNNIPQNVGTI